MILKIYKYVSNYFVIFIFIYFLLRLFSSKETISSIQGKFNFLQKTKRPEGKLFWINGVSIGEAKSGIIVADLIKKKYPKSTILFSTSTISSYNLIKKLNKNIVLIYSPLDVNFIIKRFINKWKPDLTIFMESEIWPNIINEIKNYGKKYIILNGRISQKSYDVWKKLSFFSKKIFPSIYLCAAQDRLSKRRFQSLGIRDVRLSSNLKFLSDRLTYKKSDYELLKSQLKNKKIISLFSSHKDEELFLIDCFNLLKKKNLFFVIIPRHPKKLDRIKSNLESNKIKYSIRSTKTKIPKDHGFYIVDSFGELGLFFKLSHISVVGGSLKNSGGHNPMETNSFNCALIFGKYMQNFKDIEEKIIKTKSGYKIKDSTELATKILMLLENEKIRKKTIKNFKELCFRESEKAYSIIKNMVNL